MRRPWVALCRGMLLASIAVARASVAATGGAASPVPERSGYPVAVTVRLAASSHGARFEYDALGSTLPNPSCTVPLAAAALAAYERAVGAIFASPPPTGPALALELEVELAGAEIAVAGSTGTAVVEHRVVLSAGGGPLDAWRLRGESRIVGLDAEAVRNAFARAARDAASAVDSSLSESPAVGAWLAGRGIALRPAAPRPPPRPPLPPRPRWLAFVDAGGALLVTPPGEVEFPLTLRAGMAARFVFAQATYDRWSVASASVSSSWSQEDSATWDVAATGLDVGGVLRLGASAELRGGAGVRHVRALTEMAYVVGDTTWRTDVERTAISPTVFLAYEGLVAVVRRRVGLRIGLELRKHFGATLPAGGLAPELELAHLAFAVTVGAELGVSR